MSSRVPSFLLGGINLTYNFLGTRTARTAGYGVSECAIKLLPLFVFLTAPAYMHASKKATLSDALGVDAATEQAPARRSSLEQ